MGGGGLSRVRVRVRVRDIPYLVNSCGSYPYNASYYDDVIERDMFGYLITKNTFS